MRKEMMQVTAETFQKWANEVPKKFLDKEEIGHKR